jgi:ferredoxin, 2Fe-2S
MPLVTVQPKGFALEVEKGETVMGAAQRLGFQWPTICGGVASCKACTLEVISGADALEPMSVLERSELARTFPTLESGGRPLRLACQARVESDVVVFKRGVRKLT